MNRPCYGQPSLPGGPTAVRSAILGRSGAVASLLGHNLARPESGPEGPAPGDVRRKGLTSQRRERLRVSRGCPPAATTALSSDGQRSRARRRFNHQRGPADRPGWPCRRAAGASCSTSTPIRPPPQRVHPSHARSGPRGRGGRGPDPRSGRQRRRPPSPRGGDVVPFVPLAGSTMAEAVVARDELAAGRRRELGLPCFNRRAGAGRSPTYRRGAFVDLAPDTDPSAFHPTAGGC